MAKTVNKLSRNQLHSSVNYLPKVDRNTVGVKFRHTTFRYLMVSREAQFVHKTCGKHISEDHILQTNRKVMQT